MSSALPAPTPLPASALSSRQTAAALRAFIVSSTFWGAWGRIVGIGTAVFTGYALWLGATEAHIAYFVSIASFASLAQILATYLEPRLRRHKLFMLGSGTFEMLFRFSVVLVPLVGIPGGPALSVGILLASGLVFGQTVSPIYNGWMATIVPEDIRGRFLARKTNAHTISGILAGYGAGWFLDLFAGADPYPGFLILFAVATVLGISGYFRLATVPFVRVESEGPPGSILSPFRRPDFRRLVGFFLSWNFALGIAGPFYSVFMLKHLHLPYRTVAVLNSIFLVAMVIGHKVLGGLIDRYGSRALLNVLVPPTILTPILWTFSRPDDYTLIVLAMALNGLLHAGILTAVSSLLYGTLPDGGDKTTYFASWSCAVNLTYALSPLVGSALLGLFEPWHLVVLGTPLGGVQLVFLVSSAALLIPVGLLAFVRDARGATTREFLAQIGRGNVFSFAYGSMVYDRTENEEARARAARRMGRSRNPMALSRLIEALEDASPEVRRQAARGLGEAGDPDAAGSLIEELRDSESDIRTEAAEALGKIRDPVVVDPLIDALDDPDSRVQISAIRALSEIGGEETGELLFWKFAEQLDREAFPTLAEVLGRRGDARIIRPTLQRLGRYRSPAIRLQLINAVCRALGGGRRFYRVISLDPLSRAEQLAEILSRAERSIRKASALPRPLKDRALAGMAEIRGAFDEDDGVRMSASVRSLGELLATETGSDTVDRLGAESASRVGAVVLTLKTFFAESALPDPKEARETFLVVCVGCLAEGLAGAVRPPGRASG